MSHIAMLWLMADHIYCGDSIRLQWNWKIRIAEWCHGCQGHGVTHHSCFVVILVWTCLLYRLSYKNIAYIIMCNTKYLTMIINNYFTVVLYHTFYCYFSVYSLNSQKKFTVMQPHRPCVYWISWWHWEVTLSEFPIPFRCKYALWCSYNNEISYWYISQYSHC